MSVTSAWVSIHGFADPEERCPVLFYNELQPPIGMSRATAMIAISEWNRRQWAKTGGIAVSIFLCGLFFGPVRREWQTYFVAFVGIACLVLRFATDKAQLSLLWRKLHVGTRILLICIAVAAIWLLMFTGATNDPDRAFTATIVTGLAVFIWALYLAFSATLDFLWAKIRKN
jgi:hypothetical protein